MREIKFRAWDEKLGMCTPFTLRWLANTYSDVHEFSIYMQYTDLKDKNGVEIYEGDIVRSGYDEVYQVKYMGDSGYPAFDVEPDIACDCNGLSYLQHQTNDGIKVIGNIYENPELLGDKL